MQQKKILGFKDVVIMTVTAVVGIRWIPIAAEMGPPSLLFWLLGAIFFFLPLALIVTDFSSHYPEEGGMYIWVRKHLGGMCSFLVAWSYWITNFFYYPAILTFFVTTLVYAFNRPDLAANETFVTVTVIIAVWIFTVLTLFGLKTSKYVTEFGGIFGSLFIVVLLLLLSVAAMILYHHSATPFSLRAFVPSQGVLTNLSSLSVLMFAMAGIEIIPTMANAIREPKRILPKALLVAAIIIFLCYALGTVAMNYIASPEEIQNTTGLINVFNIIGHKLGYPWLTQLVALLITFSEIGGIIVWLLVPVIMFFKATERGILPAFLHRTNRQNIPHHALLLQAFLVTAAILMTTFLPTVNLMYQVLVLAATITFFIPYLFLVVAYAKFKWHTHRSVGLLLSILVFLSLILAIALSFVPTSNVVGFKEVSLYELELIGGPVILMVLAFFLYRYRRSLK